MESPILFGVLAFIAIASGLGMLLSSNAVHSALFLVLNFATIAVLYIVLNAPFIAMVQITVYAGAIMVLFLFVIMLLGAERSGGLSELRGWQGFLALFLAVALLLVFSIILFQGGTAVAGTAPLIDTSPKALGLRLFEVYVFPFQITGVLLLTALIGVVVLSKARNRGNNNATSNR